MNNKIYTPKFSVTILFSVLLLLISSVGFAQVLISGRITDEKGLPVKGASVFLDNTLDGASTDSIGNFQFNTTETGNQTIAVSAVGYTTAGKPVVISGSNITDVMLILKNTAKTLEEVLITAGAFEASNDKDKTVLKPLDIVTTAGAQADVVKAIETLPGTQKQGAQNGLFVRGGDASEASYIIDGLVVQNAFFSGPPGVATRSRFGAFQFKGVSFSSGGYSSRYGQALSSVLELNTTDLPDKTTINLGVNMAGVYASGAKLWKNSGMEASANYTNLQPFYGMVKTNFDFYDVPKGGGGSTRYAWKPNKDGLLKMSFAGSTFKSGIAVPDSLNNAIRFGTTNHNYVTNISYKQMFKEKFSLYSAASYSYNLDEIRYDTIPGQQKDQRLQARLEGKYYFTSRLSLLAGTEIQHFNIDNTFSVYTHSIAETQMAGYLETEWAPLNKLAIKAGLRYEHSELINKNALAPRISLAVKAGRYGQVSVASGIFYQNPDYMYLYLIKNYHYQYDFQKAVHYIANYQWQKGDRTLRIEAYYKDYQSLIKEHRQPGDNSYNPNSNRSLETDIYNNNLLYIDNAGYGYAAGAELFWRDKKTVKNLDYWVSYSYIDTRRFYKNFLAEATPEFISDHNLNIVTKYWIEKLDMQINTTYSYATGRPYYNPAHSFLTDRATEYHNLSMTVNHLRSFGKWFTVIYAGIDNITNYKNIFGYRYDASNRPAPIRPALYRSFFIGINMSLSKFDKDEL